MRYHFTYIICFLALFNTAVAGQSPQVKWESLFNGENLDGWIVNCLQEDRGKEYWTVRDGYIECNSIGDSLHNYVWLTSKKEFGDFHLTLEFQVFKSSGGNSGVQFRSWYDYSKEALNGGWMNGPQADIHGPDPARAGLIYDETENVRRWIYPSLPDWNIGREKIPPAALKTRLVYFEDDPDVWNKMEIICRGMHVETRVNGNPVTDFDADGILNDELHRDRHTGSNGSVALQLHMKDELLIRFRKIKIRTLK